MPSVPFLRLFLRLSVFCAFFLWLFCALCAFLHIFCTFCMPYIWRSLLFFVLFGVAPPRNHPTVIFIASLNSLHTVLHIILIYLPALHSSFSSSLPFAVRLHKLFWDLLAQTSIFAEESTAPSVVRLTTLHITAFFFSISSPSVFVFYYFISVLSNFFF